MKDVRKLSTIVFADIAGYTAMMQNDEKRAIAHVDNFRQILYEEVPKHQGEIIQFFGDGCLLCFDSTNEAVYCAIKLQQEFKAHDDIPVRIGIHIGDIVFKANNAFGDGVNIASRVESLGIPGAILVSKAVRDLVKNKIDILLVSLGHFDFKNVTEPIEVFALANPGFVVPKAKELTGKLKKKKSSKHKYIFIGAGMVMIAAALWLIFKNQPQSIQKTYLVTTLIGQGDQTATYKALVRLQFNDTLVSGKYINDVEERGLIQGKVKNDLLDLMFMSSLFSGECELIGHIEPDRVKFKGKYSCSYEEYGNTTGIEITPSKIDFSAFTKTDSLYFMKP